MQSVASLQTQTFTSGLDYWLLTSKINRVYLFVMVYMFAKFNEMHAMDSLICIVFDTCLH